MFESNKVSLKQIKICSSKINFCLKSNKLYLWSYTKKCNNSNKLFSFIQSKTNFGIIYMEIYGKWPAKTGPKIPL